jgi:hypothetical protein
VRSNFQGRKWGKLLPCLTTFGFELYCNLDCLNPAFDNRSITSNQMRNSHERLCARCKAIFTSGNEDHHENEKQTHVHYHDGAAFINTAKSGCCYFCTWTWRALRWSQVHGEYEYRRIHHTKFRLIIMDGNRCRLSFYVYETERNLLDTSSFITWRTSAGGKQTTHPHISVSQ